MKCNKELNQLYSPLSLLPSNVAEEVTKRLHDIIHYQPIIGIMGKTGAGKYRSFFAKQKKTGTSRCVRCSRSAKYLQPPVTS